MTAAIAVDEAAIALPVKLSQEGCGMSIDWD
jgi:hypothetical protein